MVGKGTGYLLLIALLVGGLLVPGMPWQSR